MRYWRRLRRVAGSRAVRGLAAAVFVVSVPVALIGSNVRYLFGEQRLYDFSINRYDVEHEAGIPKSELLRGAGTVRQYLFNDDDYLRVQVTDSTGQSGPLFNPREVIHMRDVKVLVQRLFVAQQIAIAVALGYPALRMLAERREGARAVLRLAWLTGVGLNLAAIGFGVGAALGFDRLFEQFHLLSFSNDFWLLDPRRDHLVQMFPFEFWQISAALLVGLTMLEAALLALGAWWGLSRLEREAALSSAAEPEPA